MLTAAFYSLKVILCSGILLGYYWLFLRNKIYHQFNRFYLLAIVVVSILLPLIKFQLWQKSAAPETAVFRILNAVNNGDEFMGEVALSSQQNHFNKEQIIMLFFTIISMLLLIVFLKGILRIRGILKNSPVSFIDNICLVKTDAKGVPFSFFHFIFWNENIDLHTKTGKQILQHEIAHVREKHSYDKVFMSLIRIVYWCNPFFWFIQKELNMIHEFVADKKAITDGDSADFAAMLLNAAYPQLMFPLTNNLFYSPVKRRLMMLTKKQPSNFKYLSRLLALPIAFFVFAAFCIKPTITDPGSALEKTITVMIDAGHGGQDKGAQGIAGALEKDFTLATAKKIKELNHSANINILLTRETDIYQTPKEKVEISKAANAALFISLHLDGAPEKSTNMPSGMHAIVAKDQYANSAESKILASALVSKFEKNYGLKVAGNPQQRQTGIWVLQENTCPAVIIEMGCINNAVDMDYLSNDRAIETIAENVLNGLSAYIVASNK